MLAVSGTISSALAPMLQSLQASRSPTVDPAGNEDDEDFQVGPDSILKALYHA